MAEARAEVRERRVPLRLWAGLLLVACLGALWIVTRGPRGDADDPREQPLVRAQSRLADAESAHGSVSEQVGAALDELVVALYAAGRAADDATLDHARRAVEVKQAVLVPDDPGVAESLSNLGAVLFERGEIREAREVFGESLRIRRKNPEARLALQESLHNLALATKESGDLAAARILFEESLEVLGGSAATGIDVRRSRAWNDYGLLLHELGDHASALAAFEKACSYARGEPHELVNVLQSLGRLHHDRKDYRAAKESFDEAMAIVAELPVVLPRWKAALLNNVGWLYHETGDTEKARAFYVESLELRTASGESNPHAAWTLSNLALIDMTEGRLDAARSRLERALALRRDAYLPSHPLIFHSLSYLALLDLLGGDMTAGVARALEAETIRREGLLRVLPVLEERRGHLAKSLEVFALGATSLDLALSGLVAVETAMTSTSTSASISASISASRLEGVESVWDHVIRSRGLILAEMAQRARLRVAVEDPETARLVETLSSARQRLANLFVGNASAEVLAEAQRQVEDAEFALARRSMELDRRGADAALGFNEVREVLEGMAPGAAVVAFVKYARFDAMSAGQARVVPSYLAFVLENGNAAARAVPIGSAEEVESLVARWRAAVMSVPGGGAETDERAAGIALRRRIWDPLSAGMRSAQRVFIVSEGALHGVSFAGLPVESDEFLVESGPLLHYLSSEKDLVALGRARRETGSTAEGILMLAPDTLGDLPHTRGEVRAVAAIATRGERAAGEPTAASQSEAARVLMGADASEAAFKNEAPGRRIIHVAAHGFFLDGPGDAARDSLRERVRGIDVSVARGRRRTFEEGNPLLLSGIVLAGSDSRGAPDTHERGERDERGEDGILLAEEIVALDLRGVEWAVLSACETGLGQVRTGEGILGLRLAFRLAGAASLIFSLWRVEDEATRDWMQLLYRARFEQGLDTAEAVRRASLELLARRRAQNRSVAPFYWAGFVAAGDWR